MQMMAGGSQPFPVSSALPDEQVQQQVDIGDTKGVPGDQLLGSVEQPVLQGSNIN